MPPARGPRCTPPGRGRSRGTPGGGSGSPAGDLVEKHLGRRRRRARVIGRHVWRYAVVVVFRSGDGADELLLDDEELRAVAAQWRAARRAEAAGRLGADDRRALVLLEPGREDLGRRAAAVVEDDRDRELVGRAEPQILV